MNRSELALLAFICGSLVTVAALAMVRGLAQRIAETPDERAWRKYADAEATDLQDTITTPTRRA